MDRKKILEQYDYMFDASSNPEEVLDGLLELAQGTIETYGIDEASITDVEDDHSFTGLYGFEIGINGRVFLVATSLEDDYPYVMFCDLDVMPFEEEESFTYSELAPYADVTVNAQDTEGCAQALSDIFSVAFGQPFEFKALEEATSIKKTSSILRAKGFGDSKLVGEVGDDPDETPSKRYHRRRLAKYDAEPGAPSGDEQAGPGGMGGGLFASSVYSGKGIVLYEYETEKKTPEPMDIVVFNGEEAQVQAVNPDGTLILLCKGMTIDGVTKGQIEQKSYSDLETPLQFGKLDKNKNVPIDSEPWDTRTEKFKDLNAKPQLAKADILVDGKKINYNESYVFLKDYLAEKPYVRVVNEELVRPTLVPIENVEIAHESDIENWPFAVVVTDLEDEEPERRIKVDPVSFCRENDPEAEIDIILAPSTNNEVSKMKKKFIRVIS